jgi:hypothetical protein
MRSARLEFLQHFAGCILLGMAPAGPFSASRLVTFYVTNNLEVTGMRLAVCLPDRVLGQFHLARLQMLL